MSIIRAPRPESNFYLLNKAISEDKRLSWAARGLLIFLLGKPDHWQVSVAHLRNETAACAKPTGRDGVYGLIDELIKAGYISRVQGRADGGKMGETHYYVSESPLPAEPLPAQPYPAEPYPANPTLVSIDAQQGLKKQAKTETTVASRRPARFDPMIARPANVTEQAWADWCQHRREIRKPLTAKTCEQQAKALAGHPSPDAVLRQSIANGWTGIFPEKVETNVRQLPGQSRHVGLDKIDHTIGLTDRGDGTYDF